MLETRPLDFSEAGLREIQRLLAVVFPHATHLDVPHLERVFRAGREPAFGYGAFADGSLVGQFVGTPILCRVRGAEERGILLTQLATHPDHRHRGVLTDLAERTFSAARDAGFGFATGIANAASTPMLQKQFGFQLVCRLDARIGIGRAPPPGTARGDREPEFERLWDRETLARRLAMSARPYRAERRRERTHLYAETGRLGIVVEVGSFPPDFVPADVPPLRTRSPLRLWLGADPGRSWKRAAYWNVPVRFRPAPLNHLWYDLTPAARRLDARGSLIQALDFDAY